MKTMQVWYNGEQFTIRGEEVEQYFDMHLRRMEHRHKIASLRRIVERD